MIDVDQPDDLAGFIRDVESIVSDHYAMTGMQPSVRTDLRYMAQGLIHATMASHHMTFEELTGYVERYLIAAFQMGRGA
ncbi:MAG: hypothetical protein LC131_06280 [Anaerolineae bacterium]|nr:hypothetical protein [Anaerolineae bacterium]